jgi:hypothetical protein
MWPSQTNVFEGSHHARSLFKGGENNTPLLVPDSYEELARHYTISDTDISLIKQQRDRSMQVCPGNIFRYTQKYLL